MINRIVMKNVASYKAEAVLETDKRVNLIYGLNGTGKSTLSGYLYDMTAGQYAECSVEGLSEFDKVLVYNQKFIADNFYETEEIHGIFTLSKKNKEAKQLIDESKKSLKKFMERKKAIATEKQQADDKFKKQVGDFHKEVWKIKTEYTGGDRVLEYCLDGLKGKQETLFNYLLSIAADEEKMEYSVEDLKKEVQDLQGDASKEIVISRICVGVEKVEGSPLLGKVIVGNKNSSVAALIEKMKNSDWVNAGLQYVHMDDEVVPCPFCQQRTITQELFTQIMDYFDKSYKTDKDALESLLMLYEERTQECILQINALRTNRFMEDSQEKIDSCLAKLENTVTENMRLLREKVKTPSMVISIRALDAYEEEINSLIDEANIKIEEYNKKIDNVQESLKIIKDKFWRLMRMQYSSVIALYETAKKTYSQADAQYAMQMKKVDESIAEQQNIIAKNQKQTVNINEAVENIKQGLIDIGITDFTIEKYSDEEALYRLKRGDSNRSVFRTLSEGEKMVISFLYFLELCKGESTADSSSASKIVVIDDPVSSLSHIYIFNIGRLIHNEFLRTDKYEQIFVLTHSLYFFYELTNTNHAQREATQKLFRLCKNATGSFFEKMKYEEIQNDYQAYWLIVKDKGQAPALIANCMRNIIEYFFNFVEKLDFPQVFQKPEMQEIRFLAFNRYMNRESHSKGQNIFDIKEFDYDSFRDAFKKVFEIEGYIEHYEKMMK